MSELTSARSSFPGVWISVGLLVGGIAGFVMRPSVFLVGQLPLETVLSRGSSLRGLDRILVGVAQSSFNIMVGGALTGALIGLIIVASLGSRVPAPPLHGNWAAARANEASRCRECAVLLVPAVSTCPHCGAPEPVARTHA